MEVYSLVRDLEMYHVLVCTCRVTKRPINVETLLCLGRMNDRGWVGKTRARTALCVVLTVEVVNDEDLAPEMSSSRPHDPLLFEI